MIEQFGADTVSEVKPSEVRMVDEYRTAPNREYGTSTAGYRRREPSAGRRDEEPQV